MLVRKWFGVRLIPKTNRNVLRGFNAAHRFATILQADRIVVLKEGRIAGIGRHEALLEECEEYRTLYAAIK